MKKRLKEIVRPSYDGASIYWYEDIESKTVIIGLRGVTEFKIPIWDIVRAGDSFAWKNGRKWTYNEAFEWALGWSLKDAQCVEFEEIPNKVLLLTEDVSKKIELRENETK